MNILRTALSSLGLAAAVAPVFFFREPANTTRTGNELVSISWMLAKNYGDGCWELYPMTITVDIGEHVTFADVVYCGRTTPPDSHLPEGVPFPLDYVQTKEDVRIVFSEVPQ